MAKNSSDPFLMAEQGSKVGRQEIYRIHAHPKIAWISEWVSKQNLGSLYLDAYFPPIRQGAPAPTQRLGSQLEYPPQYVISI